MFESPDPTLLDFLCCWMKSEFLKGGYTIQTARLHFDAAACIKKRENQLRRTTRHLCKGVAKYTEVDGGIFEYLL
jgi:hypothetical protein